MAYATAYRLTGDPDLAADATQDAYVRAYASLHRFRRSSSFSTWLYRIVVNVSLDGLRRRSKLPEPLAVTDEDDERRDVDVADLSHDPQRAAEQQERREIVQRGLMELSEDHRSALVLYDLNGLSYEEIAEVVGIPLGTVKSRINRARLALRDILEPSREHFGAGESPMGRPASGGLGQRERSDEL